MPDDAMAPLLPRLALTIEHAYAGGAPCDALRLEPGERSARRLARSGAVLRARPGGFDLWADDTAYDALRDPLDGARDEPPGDGTAGPALTWRVSTADPLFANYTDGLARTPDRVLAFDSVRAVADTPAAAGASPAANAALAPAPAGTAWRLHAADEAGSADQRPIDDPLIAGELSARDRLLPPALLVTLRLPPPPAAADTPDPAAPRRYRLRLPTRATVWKYCLLGDWEHDGLRVVDLGREVDFGPAENETLAGGRPALAIRSRAGIGLQQRSTRRFQLRGVDGSSDRVLVRRLPVAGAGQLARETIGGVPTWVSEIFVHR